MREIKFRVWDKEHEHMIQFKDTLLWQVEDLLINNSDSYQVAMQYTNLKDINGVDIYEGDIIQYTQHYFNMNKVDTLTKTVKWIRDKWNVYETNAGESNVEVIGNIYETRKLLAD